MRQTIPEVPVADVPVAPPADGPAGPVLLDVREDEEWEAGHIDGALHVPMHQLPNRLHYAPDTLDRDVPVVVVCRSGGRSAQVTAWLVQNGFDARNMAGGMQAWEAAGRPMVATGDADPYVA